MKNSNFHLLTFILLFVTSQSFTQTADETAIKAVIERETEMFFAANLEQWSATRTPSENILTIGVGPDNIFITHGWQKQLANVTAAFKDFAGGVKIQVERTNWNIRVSGNVAWATYNQSLTVPQFGIKNSQTAEIRCLEKTNGRWTISVLSYTSNLPADTTDVQEAIKKVLREETQAYMDGDIAKWTSLHSHDPNETVIWNESNFSYGGFDSWAAMAVWAIDDFSKRGKFTDKLSYDNYKFTIRSNMAFVIYDQTSTSVDGKITKTREHRVLVWQDGQWKIQAVMVYFKN
ncbi:MAG: nuclear transport factor 2 family protein [Saprospiraceae bacterium]|nr:nuclear transport factor 2 family protein [Saprospiraceae bacterium]